MAANKWAILGSLFAARATIGFQYQMVASTASALRSELGLGLDQIGLLIGVYFATGLVLALPAGAIGARFGARAAVLAGFALMALGGLLAAGMLAWPAQLAARLVAGAGAVLVNVLMTKMVTDWFAGKDTATAMAIFVSSWPVGVALGLLVLPPLVGAVGLSGVFLTTAILSAAAFLIVALVYRDPPQAAHAPAAARAPAGAWPAREAAVLVLLAAMVWGWFNAGFALVFGFGPAMLTEGGLSAVAAGSVVSLVLWASIVSVPAGGWLADRIGRPRLVIFLGCALAGMLVALCAAPAAPAVLFALLGLAIGAPAGPIMSLPALVLKPAERATGMGVFYSIYFLLMVIAPPIAGAVAKSAGAAVWAFAGAAFCFAIAVLSLLAFNAMRARAAVRG